MKQPHLILCVCVRAFVPYSILLNVCVCLNGIIMYVDQLMCRDVCSCLSLTSLLVSLCGRIFPSTALHTHNHTCVHLSMCVFSYLGTGGSSNIFTGSRGMLSIRCSLWLAALQPFKKNLSLVGVDFLLPTQNHLEFDLLGLYQN